MVHLGNSRSSFYLHIQRAVLALFGPLRDDSCPIPANMQILLPHRTGGSSWNSALNTSRPHLDHRGCGPVTRIKTVLFILVVHDAVMYSEVSDNIKSHK